MPCHRCKLNDRECTYDNTGVFRKSRDIGRGRERRDLDKLEGGNEKPLPAGPAPSDESASASTMAISAAETQLPSLPFTASEINGSVLF